MEGRCSSRKLIVLYRVWELMEGLGVVCFRLSEIDVWDNFILGVKNKGSFC